MGYHASCCNKVKSSRVRRWLINKSIGKETFYESFADEFDQKMNKYDIQTRLMIVFNQLLPNDIKGCTLLDVGCGTGHFSKIAFEKGAKVVSMDLGPRLLGKVSQKCSSQGVAGSILEAPFGRNMFDYIVCSEVIEHTPDPFKAIEELYRILKPGGTLALTVPNRFWKWSCHLANFLKLRPYNGLENWMGYRALRKKLNTIGFSVQKYFGFHLFPFQLSFAHSVLRILDQYGEKAGRFYINIGARCVK